MIVDDDEPVRESLQQLLEASGYETRGHACGEALLQSVPPEGPACLVLDLSMPGMSGIEIQQRLSEVDWSIPIIFLTGHGDVPAAVSAIKNGAVDFLQKSNLQPRVLIDRVEQCLARHRERLAEAAETAGLKRRIDSLTDREREVAGMAASGLTNKVIGIELGISERTVEIHRGRAMKKLGLRTAADLARMKPEFDNWSEG